MEDGISRGLQHRHETCCEKGGCCGRRACMVQRWFHRRDVVSGQVDLYMTIGLIAKDIEVQCFGLIIQENFLRYFLFETSNRYVIIYISCSCNSKLLPGIW